MDSGFHGTHVAGTIAAVGNNSIGIIGVAFQAHIMLLKASSDGTTLTDSAVIEAIQYATMMKNRGVNIVAMNASFGGGGYSSAEVAALQAAGAAGIVFCAAAGNNSANNDSTPFYPASYRLPNMIVVAATDQNDALASFSDYGGTTVDIAAPGVNIFSALPVSQASTTSYVQRASTTFSASQLTYSGSTTGITAAIYYCGLGYPSNFPPSVNGNIALIQRGTLFFSDKVSNAMAAGAKAAIIYNNVAGNFSGTLQNPGSWIPAISLSQADGQTLLASLPAAGTVVNSPDFTQIYQFLNGTSMATPHGSGAVAFAAINFTGSNAIHP
jgi:subtilisin family serine protease